MSRTEGPRRDAHPDRPERRMPGDTQGAAPARGGGTPRERPGPSTPRPLSRGGALLAYVLLGVLAGAALGNLAGQALPGATMVGPGIGAGVGVVLGFVIGTRRGDAADRRIARRAEAEDGRDTHLSRVEDRSGADVSIADDEHGHRD